MYVFMFCFCFLYIFLLYYVFYIFPLFLFFACNSAFEQGYLEPWRYINAFIIIIIIMYGILPQNIVYGLFWDDFLKKTSE